MTTTKDAIETYKRSIANENESEYLPWVKDVKKHLQNGTEPCANIWMPWVYDAFRILKEEQKGVVSYSDAP